MKKTKEYKLMIIENFIDNYTPNDYERKLMKENAAEYVDEDHVDEIAALLETSYHGIDIECISETDTVRMSSVSKVFQNLGAEDGNMI